MIQDDTAYKIKMVSIVNNYATPTAIILVSLGLILSQPRIFVRNIILLLLLFSIIFNLIAVKIIKRGYNILSVIIRSRMVINLTINVVIIYYLGGYWHPIWLLLALTPIATAIYDTRAKTLFASIGISVLLFLIEAVRGLNALVNWGEQAAYAVFIILISLMINDLSRLVKSSSTGNNLKLQ